MSPAVGRRRRRDCPRSDAESDTASSYGVRRGAQTRRGLRLARPWPSLVRPHLSHPSRMPGVECLFYGLVELPRLLWGEHRAHRQHMLDRLLLQRCHRGVEALDGLPGLRPVAMLGHDRARERAISGKHLILQRLAARAKVLLECGQALFLLGRELEFVVEQIIQAVRGAAWHTVSRS